jgi:hypothetical protein
MLVTFLAPEVTTVRRFGRPVRAAQFAWRRWTVHKLSPDRGGHDGEIVFLHGAASIEAIPRPQWRLLVELVADARVRCLVPVPGLGHGGDTALVARFVAELVSAQGQHRVAVLAPATAVAGAAVRLAHHVVPEHPYGRGLGDRWTARRARRELVSRLRFPPSD